MADRILVTGGAGFIGSHLVERLVQDGRTVFVVDDLSTGTLKHLAAVRQHPGLRLVVDSILNWPMMNDTVQQVDLVVHLAAAVGSRKILDEPVKTITTNVRGTEIVLDCCSRHGKPLFLASTAEVYGKADGALQEDHDRVTGSVKEWRWANACTNALDEFLALAHRQESGLEVVIGRIFNTAGPRQSGQWGMVLPSFVGQALRGEPIRVFGTGEQRRCFCHVDDVVRAILGLVDEPRAGGGVFNIGHHEEVTMGELAERVKRRTGSASPIEHVPLEEAFGDRFQDLDRRLPDTTRLRQLTGWAPALSLDEIIDDVARHVGATAAA